MPSIVNAMTMNVGDHRTIEVSVKDVNDLPVNLAGGKCWLGIKKNHAAQSLYITKDTSNATQAVITDAANGIVQFYITPTDFTTAPAYDIPYLLEVQVLTGGNKNYTVYSGTIKFLRQVITATS